MVIRSPIQSVLIENSLFMMPSFVFLGFSSSRLPSAFSILIAIAGSESVSRLINKSCTAVNGATSPAITVYKTVRIPARLPVSKNLMLFFMFA